jgi:hypothetical protein
VARQLEERAQGGELVKIATVRMKFDGQSMGEIVVNGVHMEKIVQGVRMFTQAGKGVVLQMDLLVDAVQVEGTDMDTIVKLLTPEIGPRQHVVDGSERVGTKICTVCRQVVGNPRWNPLECPGPMGQKS